MNCLVIGDAVCSYVYTVGRGAVAWNGFEALYSRSSCVTNKNKLVLFVFVR